MSSCAEEEPSLFVRQVLKPSDGECMYTADPGAEQLLGGFLDVALRNEYSAALLVGSQLVERGASDLLRVESSRFRAEYADVRIETEAGGVIKEFSVPVNGFVDPGSGATPGWGIVLSVLIDKGTAGTIAGKFEADKRDPQVQRVVSVVKVHGTTVGGQKLESAEFRFPIKVCYGCLVTFPPGSSDASSATQPNCDGVIKDDVSGGCYPGQDEFLDCRLCKSYSLGKICEP